MPYIELETHRPRLMGLAYRILGTLSEAEDAVQDTFVRWSQADTESITDPAAWLTTVCTRRCLDLRRNAQRQRTDYVGAWLPEPLHTPVADEPEDRLDLARTLTTSFLMVMERLTAKERAAFLLHDVFDESYDTIAHTLDTSPAACRKLVSRARAQVQTDTTRALPPIEKQTELLEAFQSAVQSGDISTLSTLLSRDVRLVADGGGKVPAVLDPVVGDQDVSRFATLRLRHFWEDQAWSFARINGALGILIGEGPTYHAAISFDYAANGQVHTIFIVRNPDKLELGSTAIQ